MTKKKDIEECKAELEDLVKRTKECKNIIKSTSNPLLKHLKREELEAITNLIDLTKKSIKE